MNRKEAFTAEPMLSDFLATLLQDAGYRESDEACEDEREARDSGTIYDCPLQTFRAALDECTAFRAAIERHKLAVPDGALAGFEIDWHAAQLGGDLYLERAGHGAGFRDRDSWSDDRDECNAIGEALSGLVSPRGSLETYFGDDGRVYICGKERGDGWRVAQRYKEAGRAVYGGTEPEGESLARAYIWHREHGKAPAKALDLAALDVSASKSRWPKRYGWKAAGAANKEGGRWVEQPESHGFRFIGYCDELVRGIGHKGWFLTDDGICGETMRGAVYLLPHGRYVPAVIDSHNAEGACMLLGDIERNGDDIADSDDSAKDDAAKYANSRAERMAEDERDYQRAWREGQEAAESDDDDKPSNPYHYEPERSAWQEGFDNAD